MSDKKEDKTVCLGGAGFTTSYAEYNKMEGLIDDPEADFGYWEPAHQAHLEESAKSTEGSYRYKGP